jgi:hypothetical protein
VLAQEDSSSTLTNNSSTTSDLLDSSGETASSTPSPVTDASSTPPSISSTTSASLSSSEQTTGTLQNPVTESATSQAPASPSGGTVEVQLDCAKSYTGPLYDTPSGHLESGDFVGDSVASTSGMTAAHLIGQQSWTVCHDARGHEHEFTLTQAEYAALAVKGSPQESVMEPADEAALDSFASTATGDATIPDTTTATENGSTSVSPTIEVNPPAPSTVDQVDDASTTTISDDSTTSATTAEDNSTSTTSSSSSTSSPSDQ